MWLSFDADSERCEDRERRSCGESVRGQAVTHPKKRRAGDSLTGAPLALKLRPGQTFSVLAASPLQGLSIQGAEWDLAGRDLPLGSGVPISNRAAGSAVTLYLQAGTALVTVLEDEMLEGVAAERQRAGERRLQRAPPPF